MQIHKVLCSSRNLSGKLEGVNEAVARAASLPILLCHGRGIVELFITVTGVVYMYPCSQCLLRASNTLFFVLCLCCFKT